MFKKIIRIKKQNRDIKRLFFSPPLRKRDPQKRSRAVQTIGYVVETHRSHRFTFSTSLQTHFSQGPHMARQPPGISDGIPALVVTSDGKPVFELEKHIEYIISVRC